MLKQKTVFFILLVFALAFQKADFTLYKTITGTANYFTTDNIGNAYIIKEDVIEKHDSTGNLFKTYSNKLLGRITSVDASNPLKLLLFYKDFSQLIFLDNMLSISGDPVRLADYGLEQAQLACSSHNNGIWIYNLQNFELIRFDQSLQQTQRTGNIIQLTGLKINPNYLMEYNNKVYLNDPLNGILIFDIYGTYYKTVPIKNLYSFQVKGDDIVYYSDKKLKLFDIKTLYEEFFTVPDSLATSARSEKDRLYLFTKNALNIYRNK